MMLIVMEDDWRFVEVDDVEELLVGFSSRRLRRFRGSERSDVVLLVIEVDASRVFV